MEEDYPLGPLSVVNGLPVSLLSFLHFSTSLFRRTRPCGLRPVLACSVYLSRSANTLGPDDARQLKTT